MARKRISRDRAKLGVAIVEPIWFLTCEENVIYVSLFLLCERYVETRGRIYI
jgi:hypothetical protein